MTFQLIELLLIEKRERERKEKKVSERKRDRNT